jgi:MFS family permease
LGVQLGRALRHRNYRLFFFGQGISVIGTWLTRFATTWMAYRLSGSAVVLGLVGFFNWAPTAVIAPFAGVLLDRLDRHRMLVATQVAAMLQSCALATLALGGWMTVEALIALGALQAVINAFDMPARQSYVQYMIEDRGDLANAIALNSSLINVARLIGPVIAAALVATVGEGWCFAIDAASYVAVIGSLLAMRVSRRPPARVPKHVAAELRDGISCVWHTPVIRTVLLLLAASSILGGAYTTLLPLIAADTLGGGPHTLGWMMASAGLGALIGVLYLAARTTVLGLGRVIARCAFALGAGLAALELATTIYIAVPIMFVIGGAIIMQIAATNTLVQTLVDEDKLGRVMSLYAVAIFGSSPLGALIEGALAARIGVIHTFLVAGLLCMVCAIAFALALPRLRAASRPLYVRLGLLEDV